MSDEVFGTFMAEVIEFSDGGAWGVVLITDDEGNEVDTFTGSVAEFQASGEWRLLDNLGGDAGLKPEPLKPPKGSHGAL